MPRWLRQGRHRRCGCVLTVLLHDWVHNPLLRLLPSLNQAAQLVQQRLLLLLLVLLLLQQALLTFRGLEPGLWLILGLDYAGGSDCGNRGQLFQSRWWSRCFAKLCGRQPWSFYLLKVLSLNYLLLLLSWLALILILSKYHHDRNVLQRLSLLEAFNLHRLLRLTLRLLLNSSFIPLLLEYGLLLLL